MANDTRRTLRAASTSPTAPVGAALFSRKGKYRNTVIPADESPDGRRYHSKGEMRRSLELQELERAGKIRFLEFQPRFRLIVAGKLIGTYTPDWRYTEGNTVVVEDFKGAQTQQFRLRWKLVQALYPENEYRLTGKR